MVPPECPSQTEQQLQIHVPKELAVPLVALLIPSVGLTCLPPHLVRRQSVAVGGRSPYLVTVPEEAAPATLLQRRCLSVASLTGFLALNVRRVLLYLIAQVEQLLQRNRKYLP